MNKDRAGLVGGQSPPREQSGHKLGLHAFRALALLCILGVLAIAGCIRVEISIAVNDDGSGVVGYAIGISDEFRGFGSLVGENPDVPGMPNEEELEGLPAGAEYRGYQEDGYSGFVVTIPFDDPAQLESVLEVMQDDGGVGLLPDLSQDENGGWRLSMTLPALQEAGLDDPGEIEDELGFAFAETLLGEGWFRVRVNLPGDVVEHNADRVEGDDLVWEISLTSAEPRELMARTIPSNGWPLVGFVIAGVVVIVVVLVISLLAWRATKRESV